MGLSEQKLVMDMVAWAGNVSSSVMIIFVNKVLMNATGYGFKYGGCPLNVYITMDSILRPSTRSLCTRMR